MMKWRWCVLFLSSLLCACSKPLPHAKLTSTLYAVQKKTIHQTMHFTGKVQPLSEQVLTTPMDAIIDTIHYPYGHRVKKGEVVYTLKSAELQRQYNDMLTEYLKAKDNYSMTRSKFAGTHDLWKAGLLAKNNYLTEKSSVTGARISLMQASYKLSELMEKTKTGQKNDVSNLSFAEFNKVRLALTAEHNLIYIKSASDGVLLYPPTTEEDAAKGVTRGGSIKPGQVLALVGDLSGIRVEIDVPEVDIGIIKPGMPAIIRGVAFGKHELKGQLLSVNAQASVSGNGALPTFKAVVEVSSLSPAEQDWVKVGMSSDIELTVESMDKLLIPIAAIKPQVGKSLVTVLAENGERATRQVMTGAIHEDSVVIDSGLNVGDVVVYD